jgi:tetratricopeptide (TPR) repeat protein
MATHTRQKAIPNDRLRRERERRGLTQDQVAQALYDRCREGEVCTRGIINGKMVGCWERGEHVPRSFWRVKLAELYRKSLEELGLVTVEYTEGEEKRDETEIPSRREAVSEQAIESGEAMNRREALEELAALGVTILTAPDEMIDHLPVIQAPETLSLSSIDEESLHSFARITEACWQLTRGTELLTVEQLLKTFHPKLVTLAKRPSPQQRSIAGLASQGYQLAAVVALQQERLQDRERYCTQAVEYSQLARDYDLRAAALILLGDTYYHTKQASKEWQVYQEALSHLDLLSPLLQSRIHLGVAVAYARRRRGDEAQRYLGQAYELFPEHPEIHQKTFFADCTSSSLLLWEGRLRMEIDQPEEAWKVFTKMRSLPPTTIHERTRIAIINNQAEAAIALRDLDRSYDHVKEGATRARALGSQKRYLEAYHAYRQMRVLWRNDWRTKELADLFAS